MSWLQCAYREMLDGRVIAASFGAVAAAAVVAAVLGPVGIEEHLDLLRRVAFIGLCCALCWPLGHALSVAILYLVRLQSPIQVLAGWVFGALFMSVTSAAIAYAVYGMFDTPRPIGAVLPEVIVNIAAIVLPCSFLVHYVACQRVKLRLAIGGSQRSGNDYAPPAHAARGARSAATPNAQAESLARFFSRLPESLGKDVVYLTVSGHYVNVVTTAGSCLVLMRFADAVATLGDLGVQVHRSYWVANRHIIVGLRRDDRMLLRVTGAREIPVSRTHIATVRDVLSSLRAAD